MALQAEIDDRNMTDLQVFVIVLKFYQKLWMGYYQRWSPRGHFLKSLALASRPQVLENWPVLGSRTALFFEWLKFCGALEKFFGKTFFRGDRLKNFCEDLFFYFIWRSPETCL